MRLSPGIVRAAAILATVSVGPVFAEGFRLEKSFDLAAGDRFVLNSGIGGVTLRGVAGRRASIVVTSNREDLGERFDFRFEHEGGRLSMIVDRKGKGLLSSWFQGFRGRVQIAVDVPRATPVEIETAGGGIDISDLDASVKAGSSGGGVRVVSVRGEVRLDSSGGGVDAENIDGPAYAESSGGSVSLRSVSGDVQASSSGGGVDIRDAGGRVKADSSGGPVRVRFAAGNAKGGAIDSSGGGVVATVDPSVSLDVDASSSGGSVNCDVPVTVQGRVSRDSMQGKLNGGGAVLRLRSSGGGISINPR